MGNKTNADYFNDKRKAELMKQGRGLAALSVILIVLALLLGLVFVDVSFVPEGEMWEQCRESMKEYFAVYGDGEDVSGYSDRELWGKSRTRWRIWTWCPSNLVLCAGTQLCGKGTPGGTIGEKRRKTAAGRGNRKRDYGHF